MLLLPKIEVCGNQGDSFMRTALDRSAGKICGCFLRCAFLVLGILFCGGLAIAQAHSVTLVWTASTSAGVTGYNVYRAGGPCAQALATLSNFTKLDATAITTLTYTDATATTGGNMYCYAVTAVSANGESAVGSGGAVQVVVPLSVAAPAAPPIPPALGSSSAT
jgi:hypothetical protein